LLAGALLSDQLEFELRERRGLAYSMGASIAPWAGRMRLLVTMGTRRENLDEAIEGIRRGVASFTPGDGAAVRRAAAAWRGRMLMRRLTRINQAYFLGISELTRRPPGVDPVLDELTRLDPAGVAEAYRRHVDVARCILVVR
jgi:predicted Zn-dependent peptidase